MTTTDAPASPLVRVDGRKVREVKILEWIINVFTLIVMLADSGACNESFWIAVYMELIIGCTARYQLSHQATGSLKRLSLTSLRILTSL